MQAGLTHIIHVWSAQSTTVREGPWRKPGLLEASLTFDGLTVEMIADNRHLPPTLMKLAVKCVGPDRLCIVSDATSGAGLPDGSRFRMGGLEYEVSDGVGMMLDRSSFAGSSTLLNQMLPVLIDVVGVPLVEAVRMATLNPARVIGVDDRKGSLLPGMDADIVIFDDDFTTWRVMIGGQWIHRRDTENAEAMVLENSANSAPSAVNHFQERCNDTQRNSRNNGRASCRLRSIRATRRWARRPRLRRLR